MLCVLRVVWQNHFSVDSCTNCCRKQTKATGEWRNDAPNESLRANSSAPLAASPDKRKVIVEGVYQIGARMIAVIIGYHGAIISLIY
jgi:hypothetical protein